MTTPEAPVLDERSSEPPLLRVRDLRVSFPAGGGAIARAVDGVGFAIARSETVGLVGESGCGKSVTALSILRLIQRPGWIDPDSRIEFEGRNLLAIKEEEIRRVRGNRIAMIFQEPMTALNPVFTVGDQIAEVARVHSNVTRREAWERAVSMLEQMGIPAAAQRAREYAHQLSGGMRQRVMIAMALMMHPTLLIADEPTTALDVTIQAQILELLSELQQRLGMSMLLITHDLGVVAETARRVIVMYAGEVVEEADVATLFAAAHHPYTEGLLQAMPRIGRHADRLTTIPGTVPAPTAWPTGCRFRERCSYAWDRCAAEHPPLYQIGAAHVSRCHLAEEPARRAHPHPPLVVQAGAA